MQRPVHRTPVEAAQDSRRISTEPARWSTGPSTWCGRKAKPQPPCAAASRGDETNRARDNKQTLRVEAAVGTTARLMMKDPRANGNYPIVQAPKHSPDACAGAVEPRGSRRARARDRGDGDGVSCRGRAEEWFRRAARACPASRFEGRRTWVVTLVLPACSSTSCPDAVNALHGARTRPSLGSLSTQTRL
jgi:hypothetical protein